VIARRALSGGCPQTRLGFAGLPCADTNDVQSHSSTQVTALGQFQAQKNRLCFFFVTLVSVVVPVDLFALLPAGPIFPRHEARKYRL